MPNQTISSLPSVPSPNSTDLVPIEHGANGGPYVTSQTTIADLLALAGGSGGSSTGGGPPFPIVQQALALGIGTNPNCNFRKTATAGNTIVALFSYYIGGGTAFTPPSGYTLIVKAEDTTNGAAVAAYMKEASGDESSISANDSTNTNWTVAVLEIVGARTLDKTGEEVISSGVPTGSTATFPSIAPTNGSMVFAISTPNNNQSSIQPPPNIMAIGWDAIVTYNSNFSMMGFVFRTAGYPDIPLPEYTTVQQGGTPTYAAITFSLL